MSRVIEAEFVELSDGTETRTVEFLTVEKAAETVRKEQQSQPDDQRGHLWIEPRYNFKNLLYFFESNTYHGRCVRLKAALVAGLGWSLVAGDDAQQEDVDYRRIMQFLERPNPQPETTFTELCKRLLIDYYATGNGFWECSRNLKNEPVELYHVRAVTMKRHKHIRSGGYWQIINGFRQIPFQNWNDARTDKSKNEVLHFYSYDPQDDFYGAPEWLPSMADMLQDRGYVEYTMNLFRNQLLAKFLIIVEGGTLSKTAKNNIRKFLQSHTSIKNAGGTIVLESEDPNVKIRIEKIDHEFLSKDNGRGGIRNEARDVVIAAHGVPPRLVGVVTAGQIGGGSENEAQLKAFKETVIDPEQKAFEDYLNRTLIAAFGKHKWKIKFNEFDITTMAEDASYYEKALNPQTGWLKKNEVREMDGKAALDEFETDPVETLEPLSALSGIQKSLDALSRMPEPEL